MGIETGISFEVLARITAAFDLVQIMEKRPRPECVKAPREMLQPRPIAAMPDFKPGAVRRLGRGDYRLRSGGRRAKFVRRHGVPFSFGGEGFVPDLLSYESARGGFAPTAGYF
jgi:hypothetical protein